MSPLEALDSLSGKPPEAQHLVTLHLPGGAAVTGWVRELSRGRGDGASLTLIAADRALRRTDDLIYVDARQVLALTVHGGDRPTDPLATAEAPTRLALARELVKISEEVGWSIELDPELKGDRPRALAGAQELAHLLRTALLAIVNDSFGRTALKAKAKRIVIGDSFTRGVSVTGGVLAARAPLEGLQDERFDATSLADALNRAL